MEFPQALWLTVVEQWRDALQEFNRGRQQQQVWLSIQPKDAFGCMA
jgi:hypothetical protein